MLVAREEQVAREDLLMFINACLSCTGQREFYDDAYGQKVSLDFLHEYILGNYRRLYCRTLAAGINHFNQTQIILKLLATGKQVQPELQAEENSLITAALYNLPPHRAWNLLLQIRRRRINNRRARAIAKQYLSSRGKRLSFDAVKYRSKLEAIATHNHLKLEGELNQFLYRQWSNSFETELFEEFRRGHYTKAIYNLPYTVAEGLANKHQIPRKVFLERIKEQMTPYEKLRLQNSAKRSEVAIEIAADRLPLTKLALYILSLPLNTRRQRREELEGVMQTRVSSILSRSPIKLNRVCAVLDRSYSSSGSAEKRRRPLGIALALHYLLAKSTHQYRAFWTLPVDDPLLVTAKGQTNLAAPLLSALSQQPESIIIVSDGWDNDPPNAIAELLRIYRHKLDPEGKVSIVHLNPVFNADSYDLKRLSPLIPTVGIRDAEDLPIVLEFARFAEGQATLNELEDYLEVRVKQLIAKNSYVLRGIC